jgi:hypothetical protein
VTFENGKQLLGLEDPANRKEKAVRRTAPIALVLYSLIVLWFHRAGHRQLQFPDRPWYRRKQEPSFADLLTTLRRASWREKIRTLPWPSRLVEVPPRNRRISAWPAERAWRHFSRSFRPAGPTVPNSRGHEQNTPSRANLNQDVRT